MSMLPTLLCSDRLFISVPHAHSVLSPPPPLLPCTEYSAAVKSDSVQLQEWRFADYMAMQQRSHGQINKNCQQAVLDVSINKGQMQHTATLPNHRQHMGMTQEGGEEIQTPSPPRHTCIVLSCISSCHKALDPTAQGHVQLHKSWSRLLLASTARNSSWVAQECGMGWCRGGGGGWSSQVEQ